MQFLTFGIGGNFSATVNFADTTTTILSVEIPDWQGSVPAAGTVTNAFTTTTTQIVDGRFAAATSLQERWMRELTFDLSATDQQKTITSITFAGSTNRLGIIGVSGVVPEPSSLSLLGLGGLLALRRRR